jgi:hypothetical protein
MENMNCSESNRMDQNEDSVLSSDQPPITCRTTTSQKVHDNDDDDRCMLVVLERIGNQHVKIVNPSTTVLAAVRHVGGNDPAVCLDWQVDALSAAVNWANLPAHRPALPPWFTTPGGGYPITVTGLQQSICSYLASAAGSGGQIGTVLLAPNTMAEYSRIRDAVATMRLVDPFIAAICGAGRCPLARLYVLADRRATTTGEHMPLFPLPPGMGVNAFD